MLLSAGPFINLKTTCFFYYVLTISGFAMHVLYTCESLSQLILGNGFRGLTAEGTIVLPLSHHRNNGTKAAG